LITFDHKYRLLFIANGCIPLRFAVQLFFAGYLTERSLQSKIIIEELVFKLLGTP
jgi:hypothetical protein